MTLAVMQFYATCPGVFKSSPLKLTDPLNLLHPLDLLRHYQTSKEPTENNME